MKQLFIASGNRHKIDELKSMLEPLDFRLTSVLNYSCVDSVEEDQPTLEGNALKKARFWHQHTGLPALADDTGLEVDALNGEPGVFSARYAGETATYEDNVVKLLDAMKNKTDRKARFRTVIAFAGDHELLFEGVCEGVITHRPRGEGGFGYDPVFRPEGYDETFAELSPIEKNTISHRGKALQRVVDFLRITLK
jgi:XTP/dITP diphosphohydrolase